MNDLNQYKLPEKTLLLWRIRAVALSVLLLCACIFLKFNSLLLLSLVGAVVIICLLAVLWYLPRLFKTCEIYFVNDAVIIKRGVIIKNTHILPFSRLIYTQTLTTPLARAFGLTAVTLKAARSRIFIPEIKKQDARRLIADLAEGEKR